MAAAVGAVLFAGVIAYAVLGGADFGSGVWDLTAGDARRGGALRSLIDHAIGPVWEANHVWLVFVLVFLWTGFPRAFAAITQTLFIPLALASVGIVLRGAAFAFRKFSASIGQAQAFGAVFAASSVVTPLFLGAVAGAIASGRVPLDGNGDPWRSWLNPTSIVGGVLATCTCAFLAAVFLTAEAAHAHDAELTARCRTRALTSGVVTGAVALAGVLPLERDAPTLWHGLTTRGLVVIAVSAASGGATLLLLVRDRPSVARITAVLAVVSVVAGWGVAQYPWVLVDEARLTDVAGARSTLAALLVTGALAAAIVVPPLVWLFSLTQSERWRAHASGSR